ncbi:transposase family protein [Nonomuraea sp. NPDC004297]
MSEFGRRLHGCLVITDATAAPLVDHGRMRLWTGYRLGWWCVRRLAMVGGSLPPGNPIATPPSSSTTGREEDQREGQGHRRLILRQSPHLRRQPPSTHDTLRSPIWISDAMPGSTHDVTAAREQVLATIRPYLKDMPVLADTGYEGAGIGVHVPVKQPAEGVTWTRRHTTVTRNIATSLVLAIAITIGLSSPANATVETAGHVYRSQEYCTYAISGMQAAGYPVSSDSFVSADYNLSWPVPGDCLTEIEMGTNALAVASHIVKWDGANWPVCVSTDFYYNSFVSHEWSLRTVANSACGAGFYQNISWSFLYNGSWLGGGLWSGWEERTLAPAPSRPSWVREDGTIDVDKLPESFPTIDREGNPAKDSQGREIRMSKAEFLRSPTLKPADIKATPPANSIRKIGPSSYQVTIGEKEAHFFS